MTTQPGNHQKNHTKDRGKEHEWGEVNDLQLCRDLD